MGDSDPKAKVFISCGQRTSDEIEIANKISEELSILGFDPYIAKFEQTLRGLKDNIFKQIETSEYFLFIDFKRERISSFCKPIFRGSLFSNQELALASFLNLDLLAFQEKGVKWDDGIMKFIQGNCIRFSDRSNLANEVIEQVKKKKWNSKWKNQLTVDLDKNGYVDAQILNIPGNIIGRYYYVKIRNQHLQKAATNCYAYLIKVINKSTKRKLFDTETPELKWAGYISPNALIPSESYRKLDAFWLDKRNPTALNFNIFTDYSGYNRVISGPGIFDLSYMVVSDNFHILKFILRVNIGTNLQDINVKLIKNKN